MNTVSKEVPQPLDFGHEGGRDEGMDWTRLSVGFGPLDVTIFDIPDSSYLRLEY